MIESARREKGSKQQPVTVLGRRHAFRETYDFYSKRGMRKGPSCMIHAEKQSLSMSINYIEENDDHVSFYAGMLNEVYAEHTIQLWRSHFSPVYDIFGELVIGDPVLGDTTFANRDSVRGRIVMVKRGVVPFVQKVRNAIEAGALGIIIVDDGRAQRMKMNGCTHKNVSLAAYLKMAMGGLPKTTLRLGHKRVYRHIS